MILLIKRDDQEVYQKWYLSFENPNLKILCSKNSFMLYKTANIPEDKAISWQFMISRKDSSGYP